MAVAAFLPSVPVRIRRTAVKTARTRVRADGTVDIEVNGSVDLNEEEVRAVVLHELLHVSLRHYSRKCGCGFEGMGDHMIGAHNALCDCEVHYVLDQMGMMPAMYSALAKMVDGAIPVTYGLIGAPEYAVEVLAPVFAQIISQGGCDSEIEIENPETADAVASILRDDFRRSVPGLGRKVGKQKGQMEWARFDDDEVDVGRVISALSTVRVVIEEGKRTPTVIRALDEGVVPYPEEMETETEHNAPVAVAVDVSGSMRDSRLVRVVCKSLDRLSRDREVLVCTFDVEAVVDPFQWRSGSSLPVSWGGTDVIRMLEWVLSMKRAGYVACLISDLVDDVSVADVVGSVDVVVTNNHRATGKNVILVREQ